MVVNSYPYYGQEAQEIIMLMQKSSRIETSENFHLTQGSSIPGPCITRNDNRFHCKLNMPLKNLSLEDVDLCRSVKKQTKVLCIFYVNVSFISNYTEMKGHQLISSARQNEKKSGKNEKLRTKKLFLESRKFQRKLFKKVCVHNKKT